MTTSAIIDVVYPEINDKIEPEAVTADTGRSHGMMVLFPIPVRLPLIPMFVVLSGMPADTTANTANWAVEPGETKDVPITWYHYSDGVCS